MRWEHVHQTDGFEQGEGLGQQAGLSLATKTSVITGTGTISLSGTQFRVSRQGRRSAGAAGEEQLGTAYLPPASAPRWGLLGSLAPLVDARFRSRVAAQRHRFWHGPGAPAPRAESGHAGLGCAFGMGQIIEPCPRPQPLQPSVSRLEMKEHLFCRRHSMPKSSRTAKHSNSEKGLYKGAYFKHFTRTHRL